MENNDVNHRRGRQCESIIYVEQTGNNRQYQSVLPWTTFQPFNYTKRYTTWSRYTYVAIVHQQFNLNSPKKKKIIESINLYWSTVRLSPNELIRLGTMPSYCTKMLLIQWNDRLWQIVVIKYEMVASLIIEQSSNCANYRTIVTCSMSIDCKELQK